ncbi:MAG: FCD domain-containing protein [Lautropia sp.]
MPRTPAPSAALPATPPAARPPAGQLPARPNRYQELARQLEQRIHRGDFVDGRLPSERELALEYGASRTSVRAALMMLRSLGLIRIEPKARARLAAPSVDELLARLSGAARRLTGSRHGIADLQEVRALFEGAIARYAARHATPKEIEQLGALLEENQRNLGDPAAFIRSDMAFHLALAEIPRNPILVALNNALSDWLQEQRESGMKVRGSIREAFADHQRIYEAVAAHDPEAADQAMAEHLARVSRFYWKANIHAPAPRAAGTKRPAARAGPADPPAAPARAARYRR